MVSVRCQECFGHGVVTKNDWQSGWDYVEPCTVCRGTGRVADETVIDPASRVPALAKWLWVQELPADHPKGELFLLGGWQQPGVAEKYERQARSIIAFLSSQKDVF